MTTPSATGVEASPPSTSFPPARESWLAALLARGKRPGTVRVYRSLVQQAESVLNWKHTTDLSEQALVGWFDERLTAKQWSNATANRNLSAFQSMSRFFFRKKILPVDVFAGIERLDDDTGDGSRAATVAEVRAIVRYAWERQQLDRRCKGNRALVWTMMALQGLRVSEPERLKWRNVALDAPIPFLRFDRETNKNRRIQQVAIAPELVPLLREHQATVPHAPDDPLFPITPPRHTFIADRDYAGVPAVDGRKRKLTSHGLRKNTATELTRLNVNPRVIDSILRHAGGVQARYADVSLSDQLAALSGLAPLWPPNYEDWAGNRVKSYPQTEDFGPNPLTENPGIADTGGATLDRNAMDTLHGQPASTLRPPAAPLVPPVSQLEHPFPPSGAETQGGFSSFITGSSGSSPVSVRSNPTGNGQERTQLGVQDARLELIRSALSVAMRSLDLLDEPQQGDRHDRSAG